MSRAAAFGISAAIFVALGTATIAAQSGASTELKTWTAAEDHQNMMDQLGIKALRPGPSGNENRRRTMPTTTRRRPIRIRTCRMS